jgi:hypothetical protein
MFPLVEMDAPNPAELFQIWLNLPKADKLVEPHFTMLWADAIPHHVLRDAAGREIEVVTIAGRLPGAETAAPPPPPSSWAARADADVAIWTIRMAPGATWTLPAARAGTNRTLYVFRGSARVADRVIQSSAVRLAGDADVALVAGDAETELLLLQGKPIGEPVVQHGPFVMNTRAEIQQAFVDYQRTRFGGWPWPHRAARELAAVAVGRVGEADVAAEQLLEAVEQERLDLVRRADVAAAVRLARAGGAGIAALDALGQERDDQEPEQPRALHRSGRHVPAAHHGCRTWHVPRRHAMPKSTAVSAMPVSTAEPPLKFSAANMK